MACVQALWVDSGPRRVSARIDGVDGPPGGWRVTARHRTFEPALFDARGHDVWVVCREYNVTDALNTSVKIGEAVLLACSEAVVVRCSAASLLDRTAQPQPQLAVEYHSEAPLFPLDIMAPGPGVSAEECCYPEDLGGVPAADDLLVPVESGRRARNAEDPSSEPEEEEESEEWSEESSAVDDDETLPDPDESMMSEGSDQEADDDVDAQDEPEEEDEDAEDLTVDADFAPPPSGSDDDDL